MTHESQLMAEANDHARAALACEKAERWELAASQWDAAARRADTAGADNEADGYRLAREYAREAMGEE